MTDAAEPIKSPVLECADIHRIFRDGTRNLHILNGVSLSVMKRDIVGISGNSGSGKTTLLNILGLLDEATSGTVLYQGIDTASLATVSRARIRNSSAGFIFQEFFLIREFTVIENVLMPALCRLSIWKWRSEKKECIRKARVLLEHVGLGDRCDSDIRNLSGGEKQRVAIARALMNGPGVIFCDEPTGNLDEETEAGIKDLFIRLNQEQGTTFVIVSHNMSLLDICTRRLHLTKGILQQEHL